MTRLAIAFVLAPALALALALAGCATGRDPTFAEGPAPRDAARASGARPPAPPLDLSHPLTLPECLRLAETSPPTAESFRARLDAARSLVAAAETWPNPVLAYQAQDLGLSDSDSHALTLQQQVVSYPLGFAWTREIETGLARARERGAAASVAEERRRLRLDVGRAFYEISAEEALAGVEEDAARVAEAVAALVERRVALGDATPLELEQARAEGLDGRRRGELARRRAELDRLALSLVLGADRPVPVTLAAASAVAPPLPPEIAAAPAGGGAPVPGEAARALAAPAVERALASRPDVRRAEADQRAAELARDLEERRAAPLAGVVVGAGIREGPNGVGGYLGASFPLPLFDRNEGRRARAGADLRAAAAETERARRRVALEVEGALVAWQRARASLDAYAEPSARARDHALEEVRRRLASGDVDYLDLLSAERDALAARRALVEARRDVAVERWRLIGAVTGFEPSPFGEGERP